MAGTATKENCTIIFVFNACLKRNVWKGRQRTSSNIVHVKWISGGRREQAVESHRVSAVANCRRRVAYSMQSDIVVVRADLGSTWNQPNHPEVLPMSAVNPIADVSLWPILSGRPFLCSYPLLVSAARVCSQCLFAAALADSNRGYYALAPQICHRHQTEYLNRAKRTVVYNAFRLKHLFSIRRPGRF